VFLVGHCFAQLGVRLTVRQNLKLCQCHSIQDESGTDDKAYRPANY